MAGMRELEVPEALPGIVSAMEADSYTLDIVEVGPTALSFRIDALDGACEDCLAPHSVMAGLISTSLGGRYTTDQIQIAYPSGIHSH